MWVLTAVLAFLCLLLLSPLRFRFTLFDGAAALEIRLWFLRFRLIGEKSERKSGKEKKKKERKAERAKKNAARKKAAPKKQKKKKGGPLSGPWNAERLCAAATLLKNLLVGCGRAGAFLLRGVRLKKLWVEIMVVRQDACQTAVESGKLNAWFYGALSFLRNYIEPQDLYLSIYPGFWATQEKTAAEVILCVTPARLLGAGLLLLGIALRALFRFIRSPAKQKDRPPADPGEEAGSNP